MRVIIAFLFFLNVIVIVQLAGAQHSPTYNTVTAMRNLRQSPVIKMWLSQGQQDDLAEAEGRMLAGNEQDGLERWAWLFDRYMNRRQ